MIMIAKSLILVESFYAIDKQYYLLLKVLNKLKLINLF